MDFQYGWLLNLICYLPLAGALFMMAFINKENSSAIKGFATAVAALDFVISIPLWFLYKPDGAEFQFATVMEWIPSVGVQYIFGVDGFAVLLSQVGDANRRAHTGQHVQQRSAGRIEANVFDLQPAARNHQSGHEKESG